MDRLKRRRPDSRPNGCYSSGPSLRRSALWFIAMTSVAKACLNEPYQPRQPGQAFAISAAALRTNFSMAATNCKSSSTFGSVFPPIRLGKMICGSIRTGSKTNASMAMTATRPSKLVWTLFKDGSSDSTAFKLDHWFVEPLSELRGERETLSRFSSSPCSDRKTKPLFWILPLLEALTSNLHGRTRSPPITTAVRPEEAETHYNQLALRAFHTWLWNIWSCSGPNAGGGHEAELRLAQLFLLNLATFRSRSDKSVDARAGGVLGRRPQVQCFDTLQVYKNTNHHGPGISTGTPQGNPHVQFHEMLSELEPIQHNSYNFALRNRPSNDPMSPLLGLLTLLCIRIALSLLPHPLPPQHWRTVRKCLGQYRRVRSLRAAGISKAPPNNKKHPLSASRTGGRRPRLLFVLILLAMLHAAQAAPRSRSALKPPRKLAFLRARAQSQTHAQVSYRGRLHDASTLGTTRCKETKHAPSRKIPSSQSKRGLRIVTWNSGGLHSARWAELLQWLQDEATQHKPVHVCLVQETHWASSTEFTESNWLCMHSGTGSREGGVLTMISRHTFKDCPVKFADLVLGRLQHIRIGTTPPIDLLNVYQFAKK